MYSRAQKDKSGETISVYADIRHMFGYISYHGFYGVKHTQAA
jgi:hypothetical protein